MNASFFENILNELLKIYENKYEQASSEEEREILLIKIQFIVTERDFYQQFKGLINIQQHINDYLSLKEYFEQHPFDEQPKEERYYNEIKFEVAELFYHKIKETID